MSPQDIFRALMIQGPATQWDVGFNAAVQQNTISIAQRPIDEPGYVEDGYYIEDDNEWTQGYNEGVRQVKDMKNTGVLPSEKTEEQKRFDLRMACFKMAQQQAPRRMNGVDPEPPAETIKRAQFLEHYFTTGELFGEAKSAA